MVTSIEMETSAINEWILKTMLFIGRVFFAISLCHHDLVLQPFNASSAFPRQGIVLLLLTLFAR